MIDWERLLRLKSYFVRMLAKTNDWHLYYLYFLLRGNRRCFDIFSHMTKDELILLYRLASRLPSHNCLVEIGSYLGASSSFLAAAAKKTRGHLYCVDTWQNEGMAEGTRDTYREFLQNTSPYRKWITPQRGRSKDIAQLFQKQIDLLFIDSDHSYDALVMDLQNWLPKLHAGGWLMLHDCAWAEGVKRAIQEIVVPIQVDDPKTLPNLYAVRIDLRRSSL